MINLQLPPTLGCDNVHCSDANHRDDRDSHCTELLCSMIESSHRAIPLSGGGKRPTNNGTWKPKTGQNIPGWNENVEPFRQDSLFWHAVWLSAGRPPKGELYRLMAWCRNRYHLAVRKAKQNSNTILAEQFIEASENGEMDLLQEMKKVKGSKNTGQSMPETLEGKSSEDEIVKKFKEVYEELYNSSESVEAMKGIKNKLKEMITAASIHDVNKITGRTVKMACTKMKPGKTDVTESYSSDVLLHAPDILFDHLASIFRSFLIHGDVTVQLLSCAFLPLFKGGLKDPAKTDSYRAIAGSSQLLKLFENTVLMVWGHLLASDSLQFGYKAKTSTTQCSWLVTEVCDYYLKRGTPVICVTLDCSKAFDKCKFDKLFDKLIKKNIPAVVIRALVYIYEEQKGCVKLAGYRSETFSIRNGTRQGSVASPAFFSVYLDEILTELRNLNLGCRVGGLWMGATIFADDIMLLSPGRSSMIEMLNICQAYASEHNLQFSVDPNPAKSKSKAIYMCGTDKNVIYPANLKLYDEDLPWVRQANHLGHVLSQMCDMENNAKIMKAKYIEKTLEIRETFSFAHPDQIIRAMEIFSSDCYGLMLHDLSSQSTESIFKCWNTAIKLIWNVPRSTYTYIVENLLAENFISLRNQIYSRYSSFFQSLLKSSSKEVSFLANIVSRDAQSVTSRNINLVKNACGLSPWDYSSTRVKSALEKIPVPGNNSWRLPLLTKLLEMRSLQEKLLQKTDRLTDMINSLCDS